MQQTVLQQQIAHSQYNAINQIFDYMLMRINKVKREQLNELAKQNQKVLKCNSATFLYQGEWYPDVATACKYNNPNRFLHISLRDKVHALVVPSIEEEIQLIKIRNYIGNYVILVQELGDDKMLLPEAIIAAIGNGEIPTPTRSDQYTTEIIDAFMVKHKEDLAAIKTVAFTEFLLDG